MINHAVEKLRWVVEQRLPFTLYGEPGSGKTVFIKALLRVADVPTLVLGLKGDEAEVPRRTLFFPWDVIKHRLSDAVRFFGAVRGMSLLAERAASFDSVDALVQWLSAVANGAQPIEGDAYTVRGAATWLIERLRVMRQRICVGDAAWPALAGTSAINADDAAALMGLLYASREWAELRRRFVVVDDVLTAAKLVEESAVEAFVATIRSFTRGSIVVRQEVPDPRKIIDEPAIIAPHKAWSRDHYVVVIGGVVEEKIPAKDVRRLAASIEPGDCGCVNIDNSSNSISSDGISSKPVLTWGEYSNMREMVEQLVERRLAEFEEGIRREMEEIRQELRRVADAVNGLVIYDAAEKRFVPRQLLEIEERLRRLEAEIRDGRWVRRVVERVVEEVAEQVAARVLRRLEEFEAWVIEQLERLER